MAPPLPQGCDYARLQSHIFFWTGIAFSTWSLTSCAFLKVHWLGDEDAPISSVGLYRFYDKQHHKCISYWADVAESETDMTVLDGMHFFSGFLLGVGGIFFGSLTALLLIALYCNISDDIATVVRIRTWSRICALLSILCQAGTMGMFMSMSGEHVCNSSFSTCSIGLGAVHSILAIICYSIGSICLLYIAYCYAEDRIVNFPNHYIALSADNELEETLILENRSPIQHDSYNYGDLPPWVNPRSKV